MFSSAKRAARAPAKQVASKLAPLKRKIAMAQRREPASFQNTAPAQQSDTATLQETTARVSQQSQAWQLFASAKLAPTTVKETFAAHAGKTIHFPALEDPCFASGLWGPFRGPSKDGDPRFGQMERIESLALADCVGDSISICLAQSTEELVGEKWLSSFTISPRVKRVFGGAALRSAGQRSLNWEGM